MAEAVTPGRAALNARAAAPWPLVSVAILAYNRRDELRDTLTRLGRDLDYPSDRLEVLVVDNASTDGTGEMLAAEFPAVEVLRMPSNLGAPALNRAFARARGEWVLVLDDDCWIDGAALRLAVAAAEANRADLVSFRVRSGVDPDYFFNDDYSMGLFGFWGCAWVISRAALDRLEGYDPSIFIWGNEVELTMRLLDAGFRHLYLPEVVAVHMKPPVSESAGFRPRRVNLRHWAYTAARHLTPRDALAVVGRLVLTTLIDIRAISPIAVTALPEPLLGALAGVRARDPVRPEVSHLYRDAFVSFANPLQFLRTPRQRVADLVRRTRSPGGFDAFFRRHRALYPTLEPAVLEA